MGMTPDHFFDAFVLGNYCDFAAHPNCVRRAFNAAIAASHMADQYFHYWDRHDKREVKEFTDLSAYLQHVVKETNGWFHDIRSIANAYKHLYTVKDPHSSISSGGDIEVLHIEIEDEEVSEIGGEYEEVWYRRKTGKQLEFLPCLKAVVDYWQREV